ncbi:hypothetical protein PsorP6_009614 [Peronosclerospora sorghi]|uniref:Uncharacterized protein n=1 Tax=Peronosclerospora sorghi TaxID=230839 RepID=A0ACC0VZC9_9STRA|nr:hypothetical protein PsorP6_009614 [Peronosclerospora sorghi]
MSLRNGLQLRERKAHRQGLSFNAPGGLALTRMVDKKIYSNPVGFNFEVALQAQRYRSKAYSFMGKTVQNFKPVLWGIASIRRVRVTMAFATGEI